MIRHIGPCRVRADKVRGQRMGTQSSLESPGPLEEMINGREWGDLVVAGCSLRPSSMQKSLLNQVEHEVCRSPHQKEGIVNFRAPQSNPQRLIMHGLRYAYDPSIPKAKAKGS